MGVESIWYSVVASNGLSAIVLLIIYATRIWEKDTLGAVSYTHLQRSVFDNILNYGMRADQLVKYVNIGGIAALGLFAVGQRQVLK